jgi:hypothetical protein
MVYWTKSAQILSWPETAFHSPSPDCQELGQGHKRLSPLRAVDMLWIQLGGSMNKIASISYRGRSDLGKTDGIS